MKMTPLQAYVLANIDRVTLRPSVNNRVPSRDRWLLDGKECLAQITGLAVRKLITQDSTGLYRRLAAPTIKSIGDRSHLMSAADLMRVVSFRARFRSRNRTAAAKE